MGCERTQLQENRITELSQGSQRIKLAEEVLKRERKNSVTVIMTDGREVRGELTVDAKILKIARGYVHGVFNEMMQDGQAEDVRRIANERKI